MEKREEDYNLIDWFKKVVLNNYVNFEGRARRKEYWNYLLVYLAIYISLYIVVFAAASVSGTIAGIISVLLIIFALGMLIPSLGVAVRRLHDVDKSGWFLLLNLVPFGGFYVLYLLITEGTIGTNQYGNDPKNVGNEIHEIGTTQE